MKHLVTCTLLISCFACNDTRKPAVPATKEGSTADVFPVSLFFNQQIHEIDSLKLPTVKYTITGNKNDTVPISMEEFKALAQEFIEADISRPSVRSEYKETSFADQSIPSITLNYATENGELPVQRMDVILDPNPVLDDQVKTIYIEKQEIINDTMIAKKLYWKSHKNFQVITSKRIGDKPETISQVKVAWNNSDQF